MFYFTVKDGQGYYCWAFEPIVTDDGQPRLVGHAATQCENLSNESLAEIISAVKRWYDVYDTIRSLSASPA